jgi:hypothetical protein
MERIEPIRSNEEPSWVAPTAATRRVERRQEGEDARQRQQRRRPHTAPDGHPDADGHIDVEA